MKAGSQVSTVSIEDSYPLSPMQQGMLFSTLLDPGSGVDIEQLLCELHEALDALGRRSGVLTVNLGTGRGNSVLEMVRAFATASGKPVPYRIMARRPGDVAQCFADPALALVVLGWKAELGIEAMCADTRRWQQRAAELLNERDE